MSTSFSIYQGCPILSNHFCTLPIPTLIQPNQVLLYPIQPYTTLHNTTQPFPTLTSPNPSPPYLTGCLLSSIRWQKLHCVLASLAHIWWTNFGHSSLQVEYTQGPPGGVHSETNTNMEKIWQICGMEKRVECFCLFYHSTYFSILSIFSSSFKFAQWSSSLVSPTPSLSMKKKTAMDFAPSGPYACSKFMIITLKKIMLIRIELGTTCLIVGLLLFKT